MKPHRRHAAPVVIEEAITSRTRAEEVDNAHPYRSFTSREGETMNYVVSLLGCVNIVPPLDATTVRGLNAEFAIMNLLVRPPDGWSPVRFRIAPTGTHLVTDEDPGATDIESWGEFFWASEQIAYIAETVAALDRTIEGLVYRRGDHKDDVFVLKIRNGEVYEHQATYRPVGTLVEAPRERMTIEKGEWWVDED